MGTVAVGTTASVFFPLAGSITVTPGQRARVRVENPRGADSFVQADIAAARAFSVAAGETVFIDAIGVDATYTDPATSGGVVTGYTAAQLSALAAAGGLTPGTQYQASDSLRFGRAASSSALKWDLPRAMRRIALMGDSIAQQNTDDSATFLDYNDNGWLPWAMCRLGWPWYLPLANNFAVNGTSTDVIISDQLPLVLAEHAARPIDRIFISCGTNDTNSGNALATIKDNFATLFGRLLDAGITPVHIGVLPRGNDGSLTNAKRMNMALNEWMQWYAYTRGGLEFIDCSLAIANNASAFGNALGTMTDGSYLHPISLGAFHMGKVIADYYRAMGIAPDVRFATQAADQFDATYNPNGVVFASPNPVMTGGATAPTGMTTSGGTWAVGTRTLDNGQTKPVVNCTLAASATHYLYDDNVATGAWDSEAIGEGDWVYGQCELVLTGVSGLSSCSLQLNESDGTTTRQARCLDVGTAMALTPDTPLTLTLRTPPIQVQPYSGSSNASVFLRQNIVTSGGAGSVSIRAFEMRKWVGEV